MVTKNRNYLLVGLILILIVLIFASYFVGFKQGQISFKENGLIIKEGNNTYYEHFENYYRISYGADGNKFLLEIDNPCISVQKSFGESMQPYYDNETISVIDTCFPKENLKIGDVIIFYSDWNLSVLLHHRIIDINYNKELIQTKGDNWDEKDQFISFSQVYGKEIGVLNILNDKKVIKELQSQANESTALTCVCSSNSILKVCGPDKSLLMSDSFVITNNLKKENCKITE